VEGKRFLCGFQREKLAGKSKKRPLTSWERGWANPFLRGGGRIAPHPIRWERGPSRIHTIMKNLERKKERTVINNLSGRRKRGGGYSGKDDSAVSEKMGPLGAFVGGKGEEGCSWEGRK